MAVERACKAGDNVAADGLFTYKPLPWLSLPALQVGPEAGRRLRSAVCEAPFPGVSAQQDVCGLGGVSTSRAQALLLQRGGSADRGAEQTWSKSSVNEAGHWLLCGVCVCGLSRLPVGPTMPKEVT